MDTAALGFEDDDQPNLSIVLSANSDAPSYVPTALARGQDAERRPTSPCGDRQQERTLVMIALEKLQESDRREAERDREKAQAWIPPSHVANTSVIKDITDESEGISGIARACLGNHEGPALTTKKHC